jgi:hypothetical protein
MQDRSAFGDRPYLSEPLPFKSYTEGVVLFRRKPEHDWDIYSIDKTWSAASNRASDAMDAHPDWEFRLAVKQVEWSWMP